MLFCCDKILTRISYNLLLSYGTEVRVNIIYDDIYMNTILLRVGLLRKLVEQVHSFGMISILRASVNF